MKLPRPDQLKQSNLSIQESFDFLAEAYPKLLKEVDLSRDYALGVLRDREDGASAEMSLLKAKGKVSALIEENIAQLDRHGAEERRSLEALRQAVSGVANLRIKIDDIIDSSGGLEVISLNSMVQALKVGSEGGGFSYIAGEMNRRTNATTALAKELASRQRSLIEKTENLYQNADMVSGIGTAVSREGAAPIQEDVESLHRSVENLYSSMTDLSEKALDVKAPLYSLMESIQGQDIVRQSLDQVLRILESLPQSEGLQDDHILDDLSYGEKASEIGAAIIKETEARLRNNASNLKEHLRAIEGVVMSLRRHHGELLEGAVLESHRDDAMGRAQDLFGSIEAHRNRLTELVADMENGVTAMNHISAAVLRETRGILDSANLMLETIDGFWSIIIAARMESVKLATLSNLGQTVEEMHTVVNAIRDEAVDTSALASKTLTNAETALVEHRSCIEAMHLQSGSFDYELKESMEALKDSVDTMMKDLASFTVFSDAFLRLFEESRAKMKRIEGAGDSLLSLREDLKACSREYQVLFGVELEKRHISEWQIRDSRLRDLIDGFTIFASKRVAHDVTGAAIDTVAQEEGDVILF